MAKNKFQINIDDGRECVPIYNQRKEKIGQFFYAPADIVGIVNRFNSAQKELVEFIKPLEQEVPEFAPNEDESGMIDFTAQLKPFVEAEQKLFDAIDNIVDSKGAGKALFSGMGPFAFYKGQFYCFYILDVLQDFLTEQLEEHLKKAEKGVGKYLKPSAGLAA